MTNPFKPTYLYIKQHSITGKLYFGKTTSIYPIKYMGSGTYWKPHIKLHGKEFVETLWYCLFLDQEELTKFALMFSEQQNIVESELWLNLKEETGEDGGAPIGNKNGLGHKKIHKPSIETRAKISASMEGKKNALGYKPTPETRTKMSASKMGNKNALGCKQTKISRGKISLTRSEKIG